MSTNYSFKEDSHMDGQVANTVKTPNIDLKNQESYFDGSSILLVLIDIGVALGSLLTLFIATPWLVCARERWYCKHTRIHNVAVTFDGKGIQLVGKQIVWTLLTIITIGIYLFWVNFKYRSWIAKHTHYCNYEAEGKFDGGLLGFIGINIVSNLVLIFTLGLLLPWCICYRYRWYTKHTIISGYRRDFDGRALQLFGKWILWILLTIITIGIYGLFLPGKYHKWLISHTVSQELVNSANYAKLRAETETSFSK